MVDRTGIEDACGHLTPTSNLLPPTLRKTLLMMMILMVMIVVMMMDTHLKSLASHVEEDGAVRLALLRLARAI